MTDFFRRVIKFNTFLVHYDQFDKKVFRRFFVPDILDFFDFIDLTDNSFRGDTTVSWELNIT